MSSIMRRAGVAALMVLAMGACGDRAETAAPLTAAAVEDQLPFAETTTTVETVPPTTAAPTTTVPPTTAAPTTVATAPPTTKATASPTTRPPVTEAPAPVVAPVVSPAGVYYANCSAARAAGAAPVHRGDPGYAPHLDRDNDGVGCE